MAIQTIDQLATIDEIDQVWQWLVQNANIDEFFEEDGNKLERLQIIRCNQRIEIMRVWRGNRPALPQAQAARQLASRW